MGYFRIIKTNECDKILELSSSRAISWINNTEFRKLDIVYYYGDIGLLHGYAGTLIEWNPHFKNLLFSPHSDKFVEIYYNNSGFLTYYEKYKAFGISAYVLKLVQHHSDIIEF